MSSSIAPSLTDQDRGSLTPEDHAFLDEVRPHQNPSLVPQSASVAPPSEVRPPPTRSLVLFVVIAGTASIILGLAALRFLAGLLL